MSTPPHVAPDVMTHRTYDGFHVSRAQIVAPRDEAELARALRRASAAGRRVVVRGAGLSLDRHAVGDDLVVLTRHLDRLDLNTVTGTLTVGPGVTWGEVLDATAPHGLVPRSVPTAPDITVGGTLATNALSRFSALHGQESAGVQSLRLMTLDGRLHRCSRVENSDLFWGVIGGLGQLGVVTSVTHRLLRKAPGVRVATHQVKQDGIDHIEARLSPDPADPESAACVAFALDDDGLKQIRCRSRYVVDAPLRPHQLYNGVTLPRKLLELTMQCVPAMGGRAWSLVYRHVLKPSAHFVDDLRGYSFFMAPNVWARRWLARRGRTMQVMEQTWVVPRGTLQIFLGALADGCRARGLDPALLDAVWLPAEDDVLLSSSVGGGFAVNLAFAQVEKPARAAAGRALFAALTGLCADLGGKVHLTKNVVGDPAILRAMYGERLEAFLALKRRVDPQGLLGSDFFDRVFGLRRVEGTISRRDAA